MNIPEDAALLRVFIGEGDRHDGRPMYEAIVEEARRAGLAGATALRGMLGYGAHSRIHSAKVLRLAEDLPVVIEIVDSAERIEGFLPLLTGITGEGLITIEPLRVVGARAIQGADPDPDGVA